jgi:hypothetical protein
MLMPGVSFLRPSVASSRGPVRADEAHCFFLEFLILCGITAESAMRHSLENVEFGRHCRRAQASMQSDGIRQEQIPRATLDEGRDLPPAEWPRDYDSLDHESEGPPVSCPVTM